MKRYSLKFPFWPVADQRMWEALITPDHLLEAGSRGARCRAGEIGLSRRLVDHEWFDRNVWPLSETVAAGLWATFCFTLCGVRWHYAWETARANVDETMGTRF